MAKLPKLPVKNYNKSLLINPNQKLLTPGQSAMMTMCTNFLNSPSVELHFNNFELTIGNFILFNGTNLGYEADVRNTVFYTTLLNICTELTLFNTFLISYCNDANSVNGPKSYNVKNKNLNVNENAIFPLAITCYFGRGTASTTVGRAIEIEKKIVIIFHGKRRNQIFHFYESDIKLAISTINTITKEIIKFAEYIDANLKIQEDNRARLLERKSNKMLNVKAEKLKSKPKTKRQKNESNT
jgi:hypothetical protein